MALAFAVAAWRFPLLRVDFLLLSLIQPSFEMAKTRIVSSFIRSGAEIRTLPMGG
jgi:hypothetical protein